MARYEKVVVPPSLSGSSRTERLGGEYIRYHPDRLSDSANLCTPEVMEYVADVTAKLSRTDSLISASDHGYLYAALVRSEGIASSQIEGHRASAKQVAVAELSGEGGHDVLAVVRNISAMRHAIGRLASADSITHDSLNELHSELLPALHSARPGYRRVQNWIAGAGRGGLLSAEYVPPPADEVGGYMDDLIGYVNSGAETPLLKAALVHAQFETIHPYEDGNGRAGRALTHTVLVRSGLVSGPTAPFSLALATRRTEYVAALTAYRYDEGADRTDALSAFVEEFAYCTGVASDAAALLHARASRVQSEWRRRLSHLRSDALAHRVAVDLPSHPAITVPSLAGRLGVTRASANSAVADLVSAGVLVPARTKVRRSEVFTADDVLDLVTLAERQLASPDWSTLISAPLRHVPVLPERLAGQQVVCGGAMPRRGALCTLPAGHRGQHRA